MTSVSDSRAPEESGKKGMSRRTFLTALGGVGVGAVVGGGASAILLKDEVYAVEAAEGYLLIDSKKCGMCETCMIACSVAHGGGANVNLSSMQVAKNPLGSFPVEIQQNQCRQCPYPSCCAACPTGAMHVDKDSKVRMVTSEKCIGCEQCVNACPFTPSRVQWNYEEKHAQKCDLCKNTPYWNHEGGPGGTQACISVCPMKAITFTEKIPTQTDEGYDVNLRNEHWAIAGFPIDNAGKVLPIVSVPPVAMAAAGAEAEAEAEAAPEA